jgi:hypothetical protein
MSHAISVDQWLEGCGFEAKVPDHAHHTKHKTAVLREERSTAVERITGR